MDERFTEEEIENILWIRGFQETSGLIIDTRNNWQRQGMPFIRFEMKIISKRKFKKDLAKPVRNYEDYIREENETDIAELLLRLAKAEPLLEYNKLVAEYNSLPLEAKLEKVHLNYSSRCDEMIFKGSENSK